MHKMRTGNKKMEEAASKLLQRLRSRRSRRYVRARLEQGSTVSELEEEFPPQSDGLSDSYARELRREYGLSFSSGPSAEELEQLSSPNSDNYSDEVVEQPPARKTKPTRKPEPRPKRVWRPIVPEEELKAGDTIDDVNQALECLERKKNRQPHESAGRPKGMTDQIIFIVKRLEKKYCGRWRPEKIEKKPSASGRGRGRPLGARNRPKPEVSSDEQDPERVITRKRNTVDRLTVTNDGFSYVRTTSDVSRTTFKRRKPKRTKKQRKPEAYEAESEESSEKEYMAYEECETEQGSSENSSDEDLGKQIIIFDLVSHEEEGGIPKDLWYDFKRRLDRLQDDEEFQRSVRIIKSNANLYTCKKMTEKQGLGIFAKHPIPSETEIAFYTGNIKVNTGKSLGNHDIHYGELEGLELLLDGSNIEALGCMQLINHSCRPNCEAFYKEFGDDQRPVIGLKVRKSVNIPEGMEVTMDYKGSFWNTGPITKAPRKFKVVKCLCGAPHECHRGRWRFEYMTKDEAIAAANMAKSTQNSGSSMKPQVQPPVLSMKPQVQPPVPSTRVQVQPRIKSLEDQRPARTHEKRDPPVSGKKKDDDIWEQLEAQGLHRDALKGNVDKAVKRYETECKLSYGRAQAEFREKREAQEKADKLAQDEAECKRREAEEAERKRKEAEEAERKRREAEEAKLKQLEAQCKILEAQCKQFEDEFNQFKAKETERLRLEAERETERRRLEAEETERRRLEAEETERKRLEAEETERKRLEAEETERLRLDAERETERLLLEAERLRLEAERLEVEEQIEAEPEIPLSQGSFYAGETFLQDIPFIGSPMNDVVDALIFSQPSQF